jgi:hypothetical protein
MAVAGRLERAASGSSKQELIPRTLISGRKQAHDTIDTKETRGCEHDHRVTSSDLKWCCERSHPRPEEEIMWQEATFFRALAHYGTFGLHACFSKYPENFPRHSDALKHSPEGTAPRSFFANNNAPVGSSALAGAGGDIEKRRLRQ